jgi:hypothetical protein
MESEFMSMKNLIDNPSSQFSVETLYQTNLDEPLIKIKMKEETSLRSFILTLREAKELYKILGLELEVHE